jgi:hypothetical protein
MGEKEERKSKERVRESYENLVFTQAQYFVVVAVMLKTHVGTGEIARNIRVWRLLPLVMRLS